ncbi:MAG: hypothetical protein J3R72DRAFT_512370 [Linnemannia gamsii]|nr:MAG: hypothetical protein J3R72DRAFT_512370 [Linnemannia gamsii]
MQVGQSPPSAIPATGVPGPSPPLPLSSPPSHTHSAQTHTDNHQPVVIPSSPPPVDPLSSQSPPLTTTPMTTTVPPLPSLPQPLPTTSPPTRVLVSGPQLNMSSSYDSTGGGEYSGEPSSFSPPLLFTLDAQSMQLTKSSDNNENNNDNDNVDIDADQDRPCFSQHPPSSQPLAPVPVPYDSSYPTKTPSNSFPGATAPIALTTTLATSTPGQQQPGPPPPFQTTRSFGRSVNTSNHDLAIKNAIAGGLLSSPSGMPPATYISKFMTSTSLPSSNNITNSSSGNKNNTNPFISTNPFINSAPSSGVNKGHLVRRSSKRKSIGGVSSRVGVGPGINATSALTAQIAAAAAAAATSKGTKSNNSNNNTKATAEDSNTASSSTGSGKSKGGSSSSSSFKRPDLRPYYPSFGTMGLIQQPTPGTALRSYSYGGPSTTAAETINVDDRQNILQDPPEPGQHGYHPVYGLRKSKSVGKSSGAAGGTGGGGGGTGTGSGEGGGGGKKGFATRLRKLRHRRGSRDSGKSHHTTSGESDSDLSTEGPSNNAGAPPKMAFSLPHSKPIPLFLDPTLPPPPPIRTNSSVSLSKDSPTSATPIKATTYSIPFGYGGMGIAPLSVVTKNSGIGPLSSASNAAGGGRSTGANTPPPTTGETLRESSSTARFKEMIKRNVGLSTPTASTPTGSGSGLTASTHSSPTVGATGFLTAPNGGSKATSMSTGAIGELVSGDEQPSSSMFSVSRMTGRKKKLTKKASVDGGGSPLSDEEDMPLCMRDPKQKAKQLPPVPPQRHHRFMPHLHRNHYYQIQPQPHVFPQLGPGGGVGLIGTRNVRQPEQRQKPIVFRVASQALKDARESNLDLNILIAELEPLPAKFVEAMTGLSGESPLSTTLTPSAAPTMQSITSVAAANLMMFPLIPMMASIIPSSSIGSGTGSSVHSSVFASAPQTVVQPQQQPISPRGINSNTASRSTTFSSLTPPPTTLQPKPFRPVKVAGANPLSERSFLFKSYQNSKFQGHYAFRIHEDHLEFGKLPQAFEQACLQYFREADVCWRFMEKKAKSWRDQRKEGLVKREAMKEKYRKMGVRSDLGPLPPGSNRRALREMQKQDTETLMETPEVQLETPSSQGAFSERSNNNSPSIISTGGVPSRSSSRAGTRSRSNSVSRLEIGSGNVSSSILLQHRLHHQHSFPFGMTKDKDDNSDQLTPTVHADSIRRILLDRHPLLGNENVLMQSPIVSGNNSQEDLSQSPDDNNNNSNNISSNKSSSHQRPNSAGAGGGRARGYSEPVHPDELLLLLDDEVKKINNPPLSTSSTASSTSNLPDYFNEVEDLQIDDHNLLPLWRQRELREQQELQWAVDDDYWQKVECHHTTEAKMAQYGLELCLLELIKPVEYELFDIVSQVEILNENRDAALFSIANASRTNVMWLESPSLKLKYEFLNWIAISLMDHGEPDLQEEARQQAAMDEFLKPGLFNMKTNIDINLEEHERCRTKTDQDILLDLTDIRICLLEGNVHAKREQIMETMKSVEDILNQLDHLEDSAKRLLTSLLRAVETQDVETALQPSPATGGLTLAETVDMKIKDVNERIVVCARIMGAARFNLNRLKYEIELEQRSIRLFRQYKIAIAVISISILFFFYLIYNRRHATAAAAAAAAARARAGVPPGFTHGSPSFSLARMVFGAAGGGEALHQHPAPAP